jgi:hypothetical protein
MRNLIATMLLLFATSAMAGNNAGFEMGGNYARFDPVVSQYNASGELFRIEGHCQRPARCFSASGMCVSTATPRCCFIPRMTAIETSRRP